MSDLPKGWKSTTLGEICSKPQYGWTSKASREGRIKYLRTTDISNGNIDWESVPFCELEPDSVEKYQIRKNDILVSRAGSVGISYRIEEIPYETVFASYLIRFNPLECALPQYVEFYLKSHDYWTSISESSAGIAIPNVNATKLAEIKMPLAPLNEQKRIVEKLEKLLGKVEAVQARLDKIPAILKRFRQAVLAAACSGKLTADWRLENSNIESAKTILDRINEERISSLKKQKYLIKAETEEPFSIPETWQFCVFDEISAVRANAIKAGPFGSSLTKSVYVPSGYKIYGQEQVIRGNPYYGDYYIDEAKFRELQTCEVQAGDILVSLVGTIGKTLIVPDDFEKGIINPRLVKFSLHSEIYNRFVEKYLNSTLAQNLLSQDSHGGTMEILNLGILKKLPLPLAPLEEQKEIVRRVEDLFKFADQIEARYKKARSYTNKLTQSILAKAFRGELVPQDERDEPASILLERIKAEKAENNSGKAKPKPKAANQSRLFE